jgi:CDP-paratose 2-epimerase
VRDAFHPEDLADLVVMQILRDPPENAIYNIGGGTQNAMSLAQLTAWCDQRFGKHKPAANSSERPFDIPG